MAIDDNNLDPRVILAIDRTAEFLADTLPDDALDRLLSFSDGLDMFDRMLVLKRAICCVVGAQALYRSNARDVRRMLFGIGEADE